MNRLRQLLRQDTAGDPMARRGVWTGLRLRKISEQLKGLGLDICPNTVRSLLGKLNYALHANRKSFSRTRCPERDRQFRFIRRQRNQYARSGCPIISVDTKKKELVGRFKNPGRVWSRLPTPVYDHDFRSWADFLAVPYGLYDTERNRGSVFVGTSHDTPAFAVDAICQWWRREGRQHYRGAKRLLILADSGGSNGARCRAWKFALQAKLADPYQLDVTVCHYPPGASKWNPIEHRLFSEVSKQWAGIPLETAGILLDQIRRTRTQTGLRVKSYLVTKTYLTGQKPSKEQFAQISLKPHSILPQWNYTIYCRSNRN